MSLFCHILPHVVKVREDEGLVYIKATGDYVFGIFHSKAVAFFYRQILPQVLLIISQLDHKGDVKYILQPPATRKYDSGTTGLGS